MCDNCYKNNTHTFQIFYAWARNLCKLKIYVSHMFYEWPSIQKSAVTHALK